MEPIQVGVVGFGTVGSGVVQLLQDRPELLERRLGFPLRLKKVADIDLTRPRPVAVAPGLLTADPQEVLADPDIRIVVELIGGAEAARELVLAAIGRGKHVVTANKMLLALYGNEIFKAAAGAGVEVAFEAAVCGGIPIIQTLKVGLAANRIREILGILNGTTNYILCQMTRHNLAYSQALAEAQTQGFAEADPTLDVEGIDAAHKLAILMSLAYGMRLNFPAVTVEGISRLDPVDLQFAREFGYVIKLLAITRDDGEALEARVHPTLIPREHLLAGVDGVINAVYVTGDAVGPLLLCGQGAGMLPTASAVLADLMDLARNLNLGQIGRASCRERV